MIANALKLEIELYARRVRVGNPFMLRAAAGTVGPEQVERYLSSLEYLFQSTTNCLTRAHNRAVTAGFSELASFFVLKQKEEHGHDGWARHDLSVLKGAFPIAGLGGPVPAIRQLVRYVEETIERDVRHYLAYMLWAEYFTVLVGPEFVGYLVERNGVPLNALTAVTSHVELDVDHVDEGLDVIDRLVDEPDCLEPMREVVRAAAALFEQACTQIVDLEGAMRAREIRAVG